MVDGIGESTDYQKSKQGAFLAEMRGHGKINLYTHKKKKEHLVKSSHIYASNELQFSRSHQFQGDNKLDVVVSTWSVTTEDN